MTHLGDFCLTFLLECLKSFLLALNDAHFEQIVILQIVQIVDHFFGCLEWHLVIIIRIVCVEVNIRSAFKLSDLQIFSAARLVAQPLIARIGSEFIHIFVVGCFWLFPLPILGRISL